jgi:hypothetical protein
MRWPLLFWAAAPVLALASAPSCELQLSLGGDASGGSGGGGGSCAGIPCGDPCAGAPTGYVCDHRGECVKSIVTCPIDDCAGVPCGSPCGPIAVACDPSDPGIECDQPLSQFYCDDRGRCVDAIPACPGGEACGPTVCLPGEYCCNESCGFCVPFGAVCEVFSCGGGMPCGDFACPRGLICCDPICGICLRDTASCTGPFECPTKITPCGPSFCTEDEYCCNESCGYCAPLGQICPETPCLEPCGQALCDVGQQCCDPMCSLCAPADGPCPPCAM